MKIDMKKKSQTVSVRLDDELLNQLSALSDNLSETLRTALVDYVTHHHKESSEFSKLVKEFNIQPIVHKIHDVENKILVLSESLKIQQKLLLNIYRRSVFAANYSMASLSQITTEDTQKVLQQSLITAINSELEQIL